MPWLYSTSIVSSIHRCFAQLWWEVCSCSVFAPVASRYRAYGKAHDTRIGHRGCGWIRCRAVNRVHNVVPSRVPHFPAATADFLRLDFSLENGNPPPSAVELAVVGSNRHPYHLAHDRCKYLDCTRPARWRECVMVVFAAAASTK